MGILFGFLGGLALFIYGMQTMADGLQKTAGDRLRKSLEILTSIPVIGVAVGALVTAIIQSSSATTIMVVGFVNAGFMALKQALCVIMGANIGTTITAQLIAFELSEFIFPFIAAGFMLYWLAKRKTYKFLGQVFFGFGVLFLGLEIMKDAVAPLEQLPHFKQFIVSFGHYPILGVIMGIISTVLLQSSSAVIGILIALAMQDLISLYEAFPVLLGTNIGTCITALLAAIGTNLAAKRAALGHVLFNISGSVLFLIVMPFFVNSLLAIFPEASIMRQIAHAHSIFNITTTLIFLPLIPAFTNLIIWLVPGEDESIRKGPIYLDDRMITSPAIALSLATQEIIRMAKLSQTNYKEAISCFMDKNEKHLNQILEREEIIDDLEKDISAYLSKIAQKGMPESLSKRHTGLLHAVNDIERVGDHAEKIAELAKNRIENNLPFSEQALEEIQKYNDLVEELYNEAIDALHKDNIKKAQAVKEKETLLEDLEKKMRTSHINRLNTGACFPGSGVIFLDLISNLKRIGDHSQNISEFVLGEI